MMATSFFLSLLSLIPLILQIQSPYKPFEEFKIELDYKFKPRPVSGRSAIEMNETRKDYDRRVAGGDPLPFLTIRLTLLRLSEGEVRMRCMDNMGKIRLAKKSELDKEYRLEMGYTDDIKDRITAHEYTIHFNSDDKKEVSRIVLLIDQDGTFMVNGIKRGKF